jgi:hypothetical protein
MAWLLHGYQIDSLSLLELCCELPDPRRIMNPSFNNRIRKVCALLSATLILPAVAYAQNNQSDKLVQTNLVSDIPGLATITDPALKNPWGVSHSSTSPFWVSNQGTSTTTLYGVTDETNVMKVTGVNPPTGNIAIPTTAAGPQGPTGQSTIRTLPRSRWEKAETVVPRTSSSTI